MLWRWRGEGEGVGTGGVRIGRRICVSSVWLSFPGELSVGRGRRGGGNRRCTQQERGERIFVVAPVVPNGCFELSVDRLGVYPRRGQGELCIFAG